MLRVRTYLAASTVHGIGIFTEEDIPRGTVVWEFNPHVDLVFTPGEWHNMRACLSEQSFAALRRYSYKEGGNYCLCLDNAQFMNHDAHHYNIENDRAENKMVACVDISRNTELLCNYFQYSDADDEHVRLLGNACLPAEK